MKYQDFINEERKTEMSFETAAKTYLKYCNNTPLDKVFVRGSSSAINMFVNDPMHSKRESKSGQVISMLIVDHIMTEKCPNKTPLRENSLIMATQGSISHARKFNSNIFYIIPYNGNQLAYIKNKDFNYNALISKYDQLLESATKNTKFKSYDDLIEYLTKEYKDAETLIKKIELSPSSYKSKTIDSFIKELYEFDDIYINHTDDSTTIKSSASYEVWTSGKCLLIHENNWHEFIEYVKALKSHNEK